MKREREKKLKYVSYEGIIYKHNIYKYAYTTY